MEGSGDQLVLGRPANREGGNGGAVSQNECANLMQPQVPRKHQAGIANGR